MRSWKTKSGCQITRVLSGRSNVFLLTNGQQNILIDTSVSRSWTTLQKRLDKLGIKAVDLLILTHAHFDHAANARRIKEKFNCRVLIHHTESGFLSSGENILPGGTNGLTRLIVKFLGKRVFPRLNYQPCRPDLLMDSQHDLNEFGFKAYLLHTPGHTPGSVSLIVDDDIAIVGDAMFGVFKWSVFPPYAVDIEQLVQSWGILLKTNCSLFIPSHGTANTRDMVQKDYNRRIRKYDSQHPA